MAKLILDDLSSLTANEQSSVSTINTNSARIETALENTLSRDGTSPNSMAADLDMNSHRISNLPEPIGDTEPVRLMDTDLVAIADALTEAAASADAAAISETNAAASELAAASSASAASSSASASSASATASATSATNAASALSSVAFKYTWKTSTTNADPTSGCVKVNNASPGSATALYISETDANSNSISSEIARWDDATNASGKARVKIAKDTTNFLLLNITSTVTDNGTWDTFTVSGGSMVGTFADNDTVYLSVVVNGTDGAGTIGGSVGATDNRVLRSDGVGGSTIQNSGVTIDDSANMSGVAALSTTTIELGNASDTTLARSAAGKVTIEGNLIAAVVDPNADRILIWDDSASDYVAATMQGPLEISGTTVRVSETFGIALSDETTAITTGTNKATMSLPFAFTVTSVYATLNTVSSSGIPTVDINEAGTTILSTKLTIDANEKTSATAATAPVISDPSIAANAEIGFDIDVAGTGAKGLKVFITGYRT